MNTITLTYGATTQSLQAWGFTYCTLHLRSRAASTLILDTAGGQSEAAPIIPYGGQITVAITLGDSSTYYWQGKRRDFNGRAHPEAPATSLQFEDVWGALERTTFQHYWKMSDGAGGVTNKYFSRLNLFQDISAGPGAAWTYLTADNQIKQIIDFAHTNCSLPVQYGDVDPIWNLPVFPVKAISCAYALQLVMKVMPDMVTKMDYSTTPPTIHFKARRNCVGKTLPFASTDAHGRHHRSTDIKPRPDLQVPSVVVQYQITGTVDGTNYNDSAIDAYPPGSTGLEENALVFPVDLRGPSRTTLKGTIVTEAIDPTTEAFWKKHKPDLAKENIVFAHGTDADTGIVDTTVNASSGHLDGIFVLDESGAPVSLADFPNKLLPESTPVAAWMTAGGSPVQTKKVIIRATLSYKKTLPTSPAYVAHQVEKHVVDVRLTLTNAPAGSTNYSTTGSSDSGDPIPAHLAYSLWCAINNVPVHYVSGLPTPPGSTPTITDPENFQWEGEHELVENTIYEIITPANVLNLSGGNADWENMNAVIYAVDIDFFKGATSIRFGPFKHLQAAEYFEMVMAFRYRQIFDNPALRNTGQAGSSGATEVGKTSHLENTNEQVPQQSIHLTQAKPDENDAIIIIKQNANASGGQLTIKAVDSGDGSDVTSYPKVELNNDDLGALADIGRIAKWRVFACCDSSGAAKTVRIASTAPE